MSYEEITGWAARIESEYREMPGLQLTERQMQRLWGLDRDACDEIVGVLISRCVLVKNQQGSYARALNTR